MSPHAETPQKAARRARKPPKTPGASSSSKTPQKGQPNKSSHSIADTAAIQPAQILQRGEPPTSLTLTEHTSMPLSAPCTPPRSHMTQPNFSRKDAIGSESDHGSKQKKDTRLQNARQKASAKHQHKSTPSAAMQSNTLTPGRASETPLRAYAGPTFHASPAASTLPLPKFFSKSVPNVEKTTSLKTMMEQEAVDTTSESEGSPFGEPAKLDLNHPAREESPLDIFFEADRKAKANAISAPTLNGTHGTLPQYEALRPDSSPSRGTLRHHSRHPTDGSTNGIFTMDMGSPSPAKVNSLSPPHLMPVYDRSNSAPSGSVTEDQVKEEQRQAKTLALKRILFSPQLQRTDAPSPGLNASSADPRSHSPKQHIAPSTNQSSANPSTGLASDTSRAQRQAALLALAQKQIPSTNGTTQQRPPSSSLRKEFTVLPPHPSGLELTGTPTSSFIPNGPSHQISTPLHAHNDSSPAANTRSQTRTRDAPPFIPGFQKMSLNPEPQLNSATNNQPMTSKSIEDDLRRILKIQVLGGDGTAGVRS